MEKSYIIELLRSLSQAEQRDFGRWLASPFFNTRQDVVALYTYLIRADHLWEVKYLDKTRIFKKIFPKSSFNYAKLRQTVHFLGKQLEAYLAYQQIADEKYALDLAYLKSLRRRKLPKVFQKKANALSRDGLGGIEQDSKGLRNAFTLYDELYSLKLGANQAKEQDLQQTVDMFDVQFIADKLKYACLEVSHNKVYKTDYQSKFLPAVLQTVEENPDLLHYPAVAAYYYGYKLQTRNEESDYYYEKLREAIRAYVDVFERAEYKDVYLMVLNYCVERTNKGAANFLADLFTLYKEGLAKSFLLQNGTLSPITFLNIAVAGMQLKEFSWTDNYIDTYTPYLEEQHQESFGQYALAKLAFERGEYGKAMELLAPFEPKHFLLLLNAKTMLLKIYYEHEEIDALESLFESMNSYLRRKEIIGYHRENYKNIVRYARRMTRINPFDKQKRDELKAEIKDVSPLTERSWLLEQIEKM